MGRRMIVIALAGLTTVTSGAGTASATASGPLADGAGRVEATRLITAAGEFVTLLEPNARAEVAGRASGPATETRSFVLRGDGVRYLRGVPGAAVNDLNDRGVAVGVGIRQEPDGTVRGLPLRWRGATAEAIPQPEGRSLAAAAVNNRGDVVLSPVLSLDAGGPLLRSASGRFTPIELPGGPAIVPTSLAERSRILTNDGRVLALTVTTVPTVSFHSYVWRNGTVNTDLGQGTLGTQITESGIVIGTLVGADGQRPFLWRDGVLRRLDVPGESAGVTDVNEAGDVVGTGDRADGVRRGILWWAGGPARELPTLGGANSVATAVDARGRVAGRAEDAQGRAHPVLWVGGRVVDLGLPQGATQGEAQQITPDGSVYGTVTRPAGTGVTVDVYRWRLTEPVAP
jgi:uncharacterized membrane protein